MRTLAQAPVFRWAKALLNEACPVLAFGDDMLVTMTGNDLDLLRDFVREQSQDAFTALVQRHLNLVYCAALRQVRSPQLAEEVAQSVFTDLARHAARLKPNTVLTAWLYQITRRTAIDVVRREARRQLREQIASEMNAMNATAADWKQIEPLLDEAMHALDDTDRTAVLLRYFENKSLREVGETLGTTDDAARKRVSRAVDQLREFFVKHGLNVGASALAIVISANAVQAAPFGLALTISTAAVVAGATLTTTATATATKAIAMTATQKIIVTTVLAAAVGAGFYEHHQAKASRSQVESLQAQQASLTAEIQQLTQERDDSISQLAAARATLLAESAQRKTDSTELVRLRNEVGLLRGQIVAVRGGRVEAAAVQQVPAVAPVPNADEEMRQLGLAASRGDVAALQKLDELSQIASKGRTNVNQDTHRELRVAFKVIGEEAGKGSETAFQVLYRATRMRFLEGMAVYALGDAAAAGNERALEVLLDPKRFLLDSSPTGPLVAAAKVGNVKAVEYLAAVANDPKKRAEWAMVTNGLEGPAAAGNATAIDALAVIGRSENEALRKGALRALENAAFNNQPRATEALRALGYQ